MAEIQANSSSCSPFLKCPQNWASPAKSEDVKGNSRTWTPNSSFKMIRSFRILACDLGDDFGRQSLDGRPGLFNILGLTTRCYGGFLLHTCRSSCLCHMALSNGSKNGEFLKGLLLNDIWHKLRYRHYGVFTRHMTISVLQPSPTLLRYPFSSS